MKYLILLLALLAAPAFAQADKAAAKSSGDIHAKRVKFKQAQAECSEIAKKPQTVKHPAKVVTEKSCLAAKGYK